MKQYHDLLRDVMENGADKGDRTGTGTKSVFGRQVRFDLSKGFPLLTTKKLHWKSIVIELLWLLRGETNILFLNQYGVSIWDEWADEKGDLGPVYGKQWRNWSDKRVYPKPEGDNPYVSEATFGIDQISAVVKRIKDKPDCRRLIVSAWNVADIENMNLPPCHTLFQFYVANGKLSCQLYQRSADLFLGVPFNIASYALLTHMVAKECNLEVGEFIHTFGDLHIYNNHFEQVAMQLDRVPFTLPEIELNYNVDLFTFIQEVEGLSWEEIKEYIRLENYLSHPAIKAEVSV